MSEKLTDAEVCRRSSNSKTKRFLCSYHHDGAKWSIIIDAYDREDAEARVKKLGYLKLDGELIAAIPANAGFLARIGCALRNFVASFASHRDL